MLKEYQLLYLDNDIPINRSFYCNNGDVKSRGLEVHVLDNSVAKDCAGLTLRMIVKVPSGEMFEATVANGLVTVLNAATGIYQVLFPNNMGKGRLIAEIQLSNTVPEVIVSRKFSILGDGSLTSDGNISVLPGAGILAPIIAAEPERVAAENLRKTDEAARKTAEATRAGFYTGFNSSLAAVTNRVDDIITTPVPTGEVIAQEIIDARQGEGSVGANLTGVKTQLSHITKQVRYSQLGSITALKTALADGTTVYLDEDINLDQEITLLNCGLICINGSKITLTSPIAGIVVQDNSILSDPWIIQSGLVTYARAAIVVKRNPDITGFVINSKIINPFITLKKEFAGSVGIQVLGENRGIFGLRVENYVIQEVEKCIELKLTGTSYINGNTFSNGHFAFYKYGVFVSLGTLNSTYCDSNIFSKLITQTDANTIQNVVDYGNNVYTNCWFYDINIGIKPNENRVGIIRGSNNLYQNMSAPSVTSYVIKKSTSEYYRLGFFIKDAAMTDKYVELKFHGPLGEKGTMRIQIDATNKATASVTSDELYNNLEVYTILNNDNATVSIFIRLINELSGWAQMSIYERYGFIMEHSGCLPVTNAEIALVTLIPGVMRRYMKQELQSAYKSYVFANDLLSPTNLKELSGSAILTGTMVPVAGEKGHLGVIKYVSSASGYSGYSVATALNSVLIQGGEEATFIFKTPANIATVYRNMGWFNQSAVLPQNSIVLRISGPYLLGYVSKGGTTSQSATRYDLVANTWYKAIIKINADATTITFTLYSDTGVKLWTDTVSTNIPKVTGEELGFGDACFGNSLSAIDIGYLDYMDMTITYRK